VGKNLTEEDTTLNRTLITALVSLCENTEQDRKKSHKVGNAQTTQKKNTANGNQEIELSNRSR
jgi:hypothetical protein